MASDTIGNALMDLAGAISSLERAVEEMSDEDAAEAKLIIDLADKFIEGFGGDND